MQAGLDGIFGSARARFCGLDGVGRFPELKRGAASVISAASTHLFTAAAAAAIVAIRLFLCQFFVATTRFGYLF